MNPSRLQAELHDRESGKDGLHEPFSLNPALGAGSSVHSVQEFARGEGAEDDRLLFPTCQVPGKR